jgi:hypothetical protein
VADSSPSVVDNSAVVPAVAISPPRHHHLLGGKKVVLEYDRPAPARPLPAASHNVARARQAYLRGNQRLFVGDADGATAAYREALADYPGYVAGYRGLGLAEAERGHTSDALASLRLYLRTVPNAHDASLIRKRVERLEKGK